MEISQVRARIIEVGQLVKQTLIARGLGEVTNEPDFKVVEGVAKPRRSPFWSKKRGFKYIDDVDEHLGRFVRSFELLDPRPGSSVFEIGPGNCYFLFLCRELRGCRVAGVDLKEDDRPASDKPWKNASRELSKVAYRHFREHFGLEDAIRHQAVQAYQPVAFAGVHDYIVATRGVFNRGWHEPEYRFWLADCYRHLRPDGKLMVHFNKVDPESLAALPLLRPAHATGQLKKLSIVSRETLGQVLA